MLRDAQNSGWRPADLSATIMAKESTGYAVQILMQVSPMNSQPNAGKYSSAWDALKRIPQREGWMVSIPAV